MLYLVPIAVLENISSKEPRSVYYSVEAEDKIFAMFQALRLMHDHYPECVGYGVQKIKEF